MSDIEREPPYLISYRHKGGEYNFTLWAESWEDAELRLRAIADNGSVIGSDCEKVSDTPVSGLTTHFTQVLPQRLEDWAQGDDALFL